MAKIERILMGAREESKPEIKTDLETPNAPGLTIASRPTTSSLSDYGQFDLRLISRGEFNAVLTNGAVS